MPAVTHIAANDVVIDGRFMRQRCAWCGAVLLDYDLELVAVPDEDPRPPAMWPVGSFVLVDDDAAAAVGRLPHAHERSLPEGCCAHLDHEVTL